MRVSTSGLYPKPEKSTFHSKKNRKVLEARCRSPVTLQRDLKRARIILLAAAKEISDQPRIVSLWRLVPTMANDPPLDFGSAAAPSFKCYGQYRRRAATHGGVDSLIRPERR